MECERGFRCKAEKQRGELVRELEDLQSKLDESGGATVAQVELNKRREAEMARMRDELEEHAIQREAAMANLRKKHADAINDMNQQMESQNKMRMR